MDAPQNKNTYKISKFYIAKMKNLSRILSNKFVVALVQFFLGLVSDII